MDRRGFLVRVSGGLLAAPLLLQFTACGGGDDDMADDDQTGASFVVQNNAAEDGAGHTHSFTIQCVQLDDAGATFTATGSGHSHQVQVSGDQLGMIAGGDTVRIETNTIHHHIWDIHMPDGRC